MIRKLYNLCNRNWWQIVTTMLLVILSLVLLLMAGCATNTRSEASRVLERVETPTPDGGKIVRETERTEAKADGVTKADLSAAVAALQAAVAGVRGDVPGAVAALLPKPPTVNDLAGAVPKSPTLLGMDMATIMAALAGLWATERGIATYQKRKRYGKGINGNA